MTAEKDIQPKQLLTFCKGISSAEQSATRTHCAISVEAFREQLSKPQPYHLPELVTRDNFASMVVSSFRVSGGIMERHILFFEYLERKNGFNYKSTILNFNEAGGWEALSVAEQQLVMLSFKGIKAHTTTNKIANLARNFQDNPKKQLDEQFQEVTPSQQAQEDVIREFVEEFESACNASLASMNRGIFLDHLNELYPLR